MDSPKEIDDFKNQAQALARKMHNGKWKLPMLDDLACNYFGEKLFDLSGKGFAKSSFQRIYQRPAEAHIKRKTTRLWKGLDAVSAIALDESLSSEEAKASLLRYVEHNEGTAAANAVNNLLVEAAKIRKFLPTETPHVDTDPDEESPRINRDYKTYAIGFELPNLFAQLYPDVEFGTQKVVEGTYEGAGVDFILACCEAIGFGKVNPHTMRKMMNRAKGFDLTTLETLG